MNKLRNLSIASVIEANKISSANAITLAMDIDVIDPVTLNFVERLRFVNYITDLTIGGNLYNKSNFDLELKEAAGEVQNITLSVQDQAGILMPYLKQYRGGIKSRVLISIVSVQPDNTTALIDFSEMFDVISSSAADYVVSIEIGAENPLTRSFPQRTQMRDRCSFRYKSPECGHSSAESCDLTLTGDNGCRVKGNQARFGGFPSITIQKLS